ncbi:hypothetical protein [Streptomyces purpureus]|uniref:hypothetical protein n=1 Tax=Streptomyces purpureus TaxID=1951 RepID=UPI00037ED684|nr:hypothetical protein [Streptomyces purpureus]
MPQEGPYELPDAVRETLRPSSERLVMYRRGTTLWDVAANRGRYAVKLGYPTERHAWTALAPARESAVLRQATGERIPQGRWERGTWSAQPWREGHSLYDLWKPHRSEDTPPAPDLGEALSCAAQLAALHDKGWVHGDVQPAHFLIERAAGTFLIDLALAQGGPVPEQWDFPYRGCLVHYEAPEISGSVLQAGYAVPTCASDVYALGASFFISATGWRHVAYPDDASRPDQRRAIVNGTHRPVIVAGVLGKLIPEMLRYDPADRPTSAEVCAALAA